MPKRAAATAAENEYNASQIQVLKGLEGVRHRPSMYVGSTDSRGLHHLVHELVDNAVDEAMGGFCKRITVQINADGSCTVDDDGRGIPVDMHPTEHRPAVEVIFTYLHAGGKFGHNVYKVSGGLHGVGAAVVNALSKWLEVEVRRGGKAYRQRYEAGGTKVSALKKVAGRGQKTGTTVRFLPDPSIFEETSFEWEPLAARLHEIAYLNPGLQLDLVDERTDRKERFVEQGGIAAMVKDMNQGRETLHRTPLFVEGEKDGYRVAAAIQYHDGYSDKIQGYVNSIDTREGGTHEAGLRSAITSAINEVARKNGILKDKDANLAGDDVREGQIAVISLSVPEPQFEGQTKTKLGNSEAKPIVESIVYQGLVETLGQNLALTRKLVSKAQEASRARSAAKKARDLTRRRSGIDGLAQKLAHCTLREPKETELFIVEGDSAGGSAKQGRDRRTQAVLPLRGKILNVEKARLDKALEDEGVGAIIQALGAGVGDDCDLEKLRYHKVIVMADGDSDGLHIRTLILTLFYRYLRPLLDAGHVFIAQAPLYKVVARGQTHYLRSDKELESLLGRLGDARRGVEVQRYKGLGELNPEQLWETTMDPRRRSLLRVTVEDGVRAEEVLTRLMGSSVDERRVFFETRAHFAKNLDI